MKILIEEIVKTGPTEPPVSLAALLLGVPPGERFRRVRIGSFDLPEINVIAEIIGEPLLVNADDGPRREVYAVDLRLAAFEDNDQMGFVLDVVSPEIYKWLDEDDSGPKDYTDFCSQESIPL